jgi:hypothetical protein
MKHKMKTKHGGLPMKQQNAAITSSFFPGQRKRQKQKGKTMSKSMITFLLIPYFFLFFQENSRYDCVLMGVFFHFKPHFLPVMS